MGRGYYMNLGKFPGEWEAAWAIYTMFCGICFHFIICTASVMVPVPIANSFYYSIGSLTRLCISNLVP